MPSCSIYYATTPSSFCPPPLLSLLSLVDVFLFYLICNPDDDAGDPMAYPKGEVEIKKKKVPFFVSCFPTSQFSFVFCEAKAGREWKDGERGRRWCDERMCLSGSMDLLFMCVFCAKGILNVKEMTACPIPYPMAWGMFAYHSEGCSQSKKETRRSTKGIGHM